MFTNLSRSSAYPKFYETEIQKAFSVFNFPFPSDDYSFVFAFATKISLFQPVLSLLSLIPLALVTLKLNGLPALPTKTGGWSIAYP